MGQSKEKKRRNNSELVQLARLKTREGRTPLLNAINLPGKRILPQKLITLREANLNGQSPEELLSLLLAEGRILRGREGNNLLVHAYRTNSLFFSFLFFRCFFIFSLIFFFSSFFLVTPCFYFLVFKFSILSSSSPSFLSLYTTKASFYSACLTGVYYFIP